MQLLCWFFYKPCGQRFLWIRHREQMASFKRWKRSKHMLNFFRKISFFTDRNTCIQLLENIIFFLYWINHDVNTQGFQVILKLEEFFVHINLHIGVSDLYIFHCIYKIHIKWLGLVSLFCLMSNFPFCCNANIYSRIRTLDM